ncbi:MAG: hypothetical protein JO352_33770 [Chloroflexi bacterium]|nr:hypothetical protein [Chloroflexota bacterium]
MRWMQPRLTTWERAMVAAMVLMALGQGLLCIVAPNQFVRTFSLVACCGAIVYAACLFLSVARR